MIHHPVILVPKLVVLAVIIVVLIILHGSLSPSQFQVAVIVAAGVFICFVIALWIIVFKTLSNPESKIAKATVLSHRERSQDGFRASSDEFASLVGARGIALSSLRPAGTVSIQRKRISVVTEGEFIPKGSMVEITEAVGSRVVVRGVKDLPGEQQEANS